eukprot:Gb_40617 [translate_table: standard]
MQFSTRNSSRGGVCMKIHICFIALFDTQGGATFLDQVWLTSLSNKLVGWVVDRDGACADCTVKSKVRRMLALQDEEIGPPWLKPLLETSFFVPCKTHGDSSKSECNMYCLHCMAGGLCTYCLELHNDHHVVQVAGIKLNLCNSTFILHSNRQGDADSGDSSSYQKTRRQNELGGQQSNLYDHYAASISPPTPPPMVTNYRTARKRKGIPFRAPLGSLYPNVC